MSKDVNVTFTDKQLSRVLEGKSIRLAGEQLLAVADAVAPELDPPEHEPQTRRPGELLDTWYPVKGGERWYQFVLMRGRETQLLTLRDPALGREQDQVLEATFAEMWPYGPQYGKPSVGRNTPSSQYTQFGAFNVQRFRVSIEDSTGEVLMANEYPENKSFIIPASQFKVGATYKLTFTDEDNNSLILRLPAAKKAPKEYVGFSCIAAGVNAWWQYAWK